jgi:multidrug resistance protein, MATE family
LHSGPAFRYKLPLMTATFKELRELSRLAIPIAAAQAGNQLMSVVDAAVIGRVGTTELAAVGLGASLYFSWSILGIGIVMGIDPLASQAFGAGDPIRARRLLWQGVWLASIVSIVLGGAMYLSPLFVDFMQVDPETARLARTYLFIRIWSVLPMLLFIVVRAYLQAQLITRPLVVAMVVANIFNAAANLLLVFGGADLPAWTGPLRLVPAMGVTGAAIATLLGSFLQLAIVAVSVWKIPIPSLTTSVRRLIPADISAAFRVGLPVGLQFGAEYGIFALVGVFAGRLGAEHLAAHQVAIALASLSFTVALGIGSAGSVRVGRAIGAGNRAGTRLAGLVAFGGGAAAMSAAAILFLLFPRALARIITNQPEVIATSIALLMVAAIFQISDGIQGVGAGVLRGAGDTRFAFLANIVGHWVIGLPIALLLGFYAGFGIVGLWWGLCAGLTAVAAMLFIRFLLLSSKPIRPLSGRTASEGPEYE